MALSDDFASDIASAAAQPKLPLSAQFAQDSASGIKSQMNAGEDIQGTLGQMSMAEKLLAGAGMGAAKMLHAALPQSVYSALHLPDVSGPEAAALENTTPGKVGNFAGEVGIAAPTMLIPSANTMLGASLIGAGTGALTTEGDIWDRAIGALGGAAGGAAGKYLGDAIGNAAAWTYGNLSNKAAADQAANQSRDAAIALARQHGYILPPQEVNPGMLNSMLEGASGKIKTSQAASQTNQQITNNLAKSALGIPSDMPLNSDTIQAVRNAAGQAYNTIRNTGTVTPGQNYFNALDSIASQANGAAKSFPGLKNDAIENIVNTLKQPQFSANDGVDAIGALRDMANTAYAKGDAQQGKALKQAAGAMEDALDQHLQGLNNPDALNAFRDARTTIAKTYSVEKALNPVTGNVDASKLAAQLMKGKPLSGELSDIANVAAAFPKATQTLKQNYNPMSPLDYVVGAAGALHNPLELGAAFARPAVRSVILSNPVQSLNASLGTSYGPGAIARGTMGAAQSLPLKYLLQLGSNRAAINSAAQAK